jgi:Trypsin-like peptidase domain
VPAAQRSGQDYPWQVHIEDAAGKTCGAGIMLDGEYVLTCAHVVIPGSAAVSRQSAASVRVRFDSRDDVAPREAVLVPGQVISKDPDTEQGDIALLRLTEPVPDQPPIQLRRVWRKGQRVQVFGYPTGIEHGIWAQASIVGPASKQSQLVQLNVTEGPQVERGFSGTAVIDEGTEDVIGMLRERAIDAGGACWMIPVSAIIDKVGLVSRYVAASTDQGFTSPGERAWDPAQRALLSTLGGWLGSDGPGGLCVVTGSHGSAREALLSRLAVGSADQGDAPVSHRAVDVAVQAAGKTASQVSRQLVTGLGGGDGESDAARLVTDLGPSISIVVDSVDAADQPAALVEELLGLVARCPRPAVRLLLGFGCQVPDQLRPVVVAELTPLPRQHRRGSAAGAPAATQARIANAMAVARELAAAEDALCDKHQHVAERIKDVPPPGVAAAEALRVRLTAVRMAEGAADGWRAAELRICERTLAECLRNVRAFLTRLDALLSKRKRLLADLRVFREQAAESGFEEDQRLSQYSRHARGLLDRHPCDLDRAEQAVRAYYQAILRREGKGR